MTDTSAGKSTARKLALPLVIGAAVGFAAAFSFFRFVEIDASWELTKSQAVGSQVGMAYILIGLIVVFGVFMPNAGAKVLNVEDAEELREQKHQLATSSLGMITLGLALIVLALSGPGMPFAPVTGAALCIGLVLAATVATLYAQRFSDELQTSLSRDAVVTAFYLMFFVGGGWAVFAQTGILSPAEPIDWLSMFAGSLLVAAFWESGKRGLLTRGPN